MRSEYSQYGYSPSPQVESDRGETGRGEGESGSEAGKGRDQHNKIVCLFTNTQIILPYFGRCDCWPPVTRRRLRGLLRGPRLGRPPPGSPVSGRHT